MTRRNDDLKMYIGMKFSLVLTYQWLSLCVPTFPGVPYSQPLIYTKHKAEQLFLTLIVIIIIRRNYSWAPNQHIKMISEGSCDIEDRSFCNHRNKLHFNILYIQMLYFNQLNIALVNIEDFQQHLKALIDPKPLKGMHMCVYVWLFNILFYTF